ncbi:MAG: hypothetical protein JKY15_06425 [Deltaproteobacteria bacterium]|nr:hypothetical protein [Deltaproteobacteria bacterium]
MPFPLLPYASPSSSFDIFKLGQSKSAGHTAIQMPSDSFDTRGATGVQTQKSRLEIILEVAEYQKALGPGGGGLNDVQVAAIQKQLQSEQSFFKWFFGRPTLLDLELQKLENTNWISLPKIFTKQFLEQHGFLILSRFISQIPNLVGYRYSALGLIQAMSDEQFQGSFNPALFQDLALMGEYELLEAIVYRLNFTQAASLFQGLKNKLIQKRSHSVAPVRQNDARGEILYPNSAGYYCGRIANFKACGRGVFMDRYGFIYVGQFLDDQKMLEGVSNLNGRIFASHFDNLIPQGKGRIFYDNGRRFQGDIAAAKAHGNGRLDYVGDVVYAGGFHEDLRHSEGVYVFGDGILRTTHAYGRESGISYYTDPSGLVERYLPGDMGRVGYLHNLGDMKMLALITGVSSTGAKMTYALGCTTDFLCHYKPSEPFVEFAKFKKIGFELKQALDHMDRYRFFPEQVANEVLGLVRSGKGCLIASGSEWHAMGVFLRQEGAAYRIQVYNSGSGLDGNHVVSSLNPRKFQTCKTYSVTDLAGTGLIHQLLACKYNNAGELYRSIEKLPGVRVIPQNPQIFQTDQKGAGCSLEWMMAYTKPQVSNISYDTFRRDLFRTAIGEAAKFPLEDPNKKVTIYGQNQQEIELTAQAARDWMLAELQRKITKREQKIASHLSDPPLA